MGQITLNSLMNNETMNSDPPSVCLASGVWKWLDKTVMDYSNWAEEGSDKDYGEIRTVDGTWGSGRRWDDQAYICKTPKGTIKATN